MIADNITTFHRMMTEERVDGHHNHTFELQNLYTEIVSVMATDYSIYRQYVPDFLSSLESNNSHSLSYSIQLFFEMYEQLIGTKLFRSFDLSILDYEADQGTLEKMEPIFDASFSKNSKQRLSEDNFDISMLSEEDKKKMASFIIDKLQIDSKQLNWNTDIVNDNLMLLTFLRQILNSLKSEELFYHALSIFIDRLTSSEFNQAARDIAEEIIIASYKDGVPEMGYFISFRLYSNIGSIHSSLLYAILCFKCLLRKSPPYSEKFVKDVVSQGIKFFRNVELYPFVSRIYNNLPSELNLKGYERRSIDHSHFLVLLKMRDPALPSNLLDYMHKIREDILAGGVYEVLPWLVTLYNFKRLYPMADFSESGFGFFVQTFEMIVPADLVKKHKDIIHADSENLKKHLKESLVKLNETRYKTDFVYDNEFALIISSRLIEYSTTKKDASSFLLSMVLKSDFSILFRRKESKEFAPLILPDVNIDSLESLYDDKEAFFKLLPINPNTSINWLALSEGKLYQLQLFNNEYSLSRLSSWNHERFNQLYDNNYFVDLSFSETINDKNGVRQILPEEFVAQGKSIAADLSIVKLSIAENSQQVYIVKDMEISNYPHNLFLDEQGEFIANRYPVTNVLSTEWLLQSRHDGSLPSTFRKSIWIPIDSGDITLNYLFSNIEKTLNDHSFEVFKEVKLPHPLAAEINIVCSHGAKNISEVQIVFQEDKPTYDLSSIIGNGKILIFFVCYSGSMKTQFFRNDVTSVIQRFIAQGYKAVIAPFWALDVTIPRYWLPEFLSAFQSGLTISQAVFNANMKVYEKFPTPAAWACMHLYGNPNLTCSTTVSTVN